jgi:nitrogen fixation NifU-like protein
MDRQAYTEKFLEHYQRPRHYGPLPEADVVTTGRHPGCGDEITIYLKIEADSTAQNVQFEGQGCTISQGSASILLDRVQGKSLAEIEAIDYNDLIETLGKKIILNRVSCATLGLRTLKDAIQQYHLELEDKRGRTHG